MMSINTSLIPRPHMQGSGDTQWKSKVNTDQFVGHHSDSRKVKFVHYAYLCHNNGIQLSKLGNL